MPEEMEVLYKRGSKFKVVGYANRGKNFDAFAPSSAWDHLILLEEVDDIPISQLAPKKYTSEELWGLFRKENEKIW